MIALYFVLLVVGGYFIGNINFARIFSRIFNKEDITKIGSKNPGSMNMLRTKGFGEALLTFICETLQCILCLNTFLKVLANLHIL